jgi:hypothetical protein
MMDKANYSYTTKDCYEGVEVDYKLYKKIMASYFNNLFEVLLLGYTYSIPQRLGKFFIKKYKSNFIDWKQTNKIYGDHNKDSSDKKKVIDSNKHTDGYIARPHWKRQGYIIQGASVYKFRFTRTRNRKFAKLLKEDSTLIYNYTG